MEYKTGINSETLAINHVKLEPRSSRLVARPKAFDSAEGDVPAPSPELGRVAEFATALAASLAELKWTPLHRWYPFVNDSRGFVYPNQKPPTIHIAASRLATPETLCRTIAHECRHLAQRKIDERDAEEFAAMWGPLIHLAGRRANWQPYRVRVIRTNNPNDCIVDTHHDVVISKRRGVVWTEAKWAGPRWVGVYPE